MLDLDSLIDKSHKTISKINTSIKIDQSGKSTIHRKQNSSSFGEATPLTEKELEEAILNNVEGVQKIGKQFQRNLLKWKARRKLLNP